MDVDSRLRPGFIFGQPHSRCEDIIRIRDLTWNIGTKNHGPALQVRGALSTLNGGFLGAADLGTRSVLESVSVSKSLF